MNCRNCGAPMLSLDDHGNFRCDYCHARRPLSELDQTTTDGVRRTGREMEDTRCPRCETCLEIGIVDGIKVAFCNDCQGILLPRREFAGLVRHRRSTWRGAADDVQPLDPDELHRTAICPACMMRMETYPYAGPGAVVIDCCSLCDLVWIDAGELNKLERAPGVRTV